jgi:hypothetical protein
MKQKLHAICLLAITLFISSCDEIITRNEDTQQNADIADFIGQWSLEIEGNWVGWLDVRHEDGYIDSDLLWKWGSVSPAAHVHIQNKSLRVTRVEPLVRNRNDDGTPVRTHYVTYVLKAKRNKQYITGYYFEPNNDGLSVTRTAFKGYKLPDMPEAPNFKHINFGEPIVLFNGADLTGWKLTNENHTNGFVVENGILVNNPTGGHNNYGNLRTEAEFEDFNLKLEVNIPEGSNSGIYLRGIYEVQVLDSYGKPVNSHHMGGIYSRIVPSENAEKQAGEWQTFDITLCNRHVTVILNGTTIIDNQPVYGPTGGALHADVLKPGPIYLQGDHGKVMYRNIVLTPVVEQP